MTLPSAPSWFLLKPVQSHHYHCCLLTPWTHRREDLHLYFQFCLPVLPCSVPLITYVAISRLAVAAKYFLVFLLTTIPSSLPAKSVIFKQHIECPQRSGVREETFRVKILSKTKSINKAQNAIKILLKRPCYTSTTSCWFCWPVQHNISLSFTLIQSFKIPLVLRGRRQPKYSMAGVSRLNLWVCILLLKIFPYHLLLWVWELLLALAG